MTEPLRTLSATVKSSWHDFLDAFEPLRPELYRYCRYLTKNPWDAEDLAQDTLARAFVTLGTHHHAPPPNPRAWLFRVASNLWIDRARRARDIGEPQAATHAPDPRVTREAAGTLIGKLSPQERAAVVLKDVFDLSLEEVAMALSTTPGAVKAALHRGRGKLTENESDQPRVATPAALDAFCAAFNARDIDRMTALLLDTSLVEIVGVVTEYGPEEARDPYSGSFAGMLSPLTLDERGGVGEKYLEGYEGGAPRTEIRIHRGEPVLLFWYRHTDGDVVRAVARLDVQGDHITRLRNYFFTPDVIAEVARELDVPFCVNGYRYW
ncbi:MAG: RNA polymerase sigma factor [Polyangiaceae bacterium]|nr:RNA polymerase sigma factor [Polyangiaceae bacterium]